PPAPVSCETYHLSLHDALPIWNSMDLLTEWKIIKKTAPQTVSSTPVPAQATISPRLEMVEKASTFFPSFWAMAIMLAIMKVKPPDRKSTRLNSSHVSISYAVFC